MGRLASGGDNTMMETFWSTMQRELLVRRQGATRAEPRAAILERIEAPTSPR
jgi:hypothetical protein